MRQLIKILLALYCFNATALFAQDVITLKSGDEIKAKVQEIGTDNVKYKKYENLDGPVYTLMKSEIFMIKYENGEKDIFKDVQPATSTSATSKDTPTGATLSSNGVITIKDGTYFMNGEILKDAQLRKVLKDVPEAHRKYVNSEIVRFPGVTLTAFGVGGAVGGIIGFCFGEWKIGLITLGGGGVAFIAGAFISGAADRKVLQAISIYNKAKKTGSPLSDVSLNFGLTRSGGVGLTLNF
jgi:hypothetical protein